MKLLHIALIVPNSPQWALRNALRDAADEYIEYDWCAAKQRGENTDYAIARLSREYAPDLTFLQLQDPDVMSPETAAGIPGIRVIWNGDVRNETPGWMFPFGKAVDLSLFTNWRDVYNLRREGVVSDFLQIGVDTKTFSNEGSISNWPEIVFLANNYGNMFPLSDYRKQIAERLKERYGNRFGLFGTGWPDAVAVNEQIEAEIYRSCKIAINCSHFNIQGYSSDRLYRAAACGAFVLSHKYPDMELEEGIDLDTFEMDNLFELVDWYLSHEENRLMIARRGCKTVRQFCTWDARIHRLKEMLTKRYNFPLTFRS